MSTPLAGRYQPQVRLGTGAIGEVWTAWDAETDTTVVLKLARPGDPAAARSIRHEYRARHDIHHPALVGVRALDEHEGQPFLVLERVEGVPLDLWLSDHPDETRALFRVVRQVTEGLAVLHRHQRVHGDVKPDHVLVDDEGRAVLIDFDLSAYTDDVGSQDSTAGLTGGTRGFMAPEVLVGEPASPASDRFALGALLWTCLAGRRPPPVDEHTRVPSPPCDQDTALLALLSVQLMQFEPSRRPPLDRVLRLLGPDDGARVDVGACVGREDVLDRLDAWDEAPAERPLLLHAPSGFGKSTVLREHLRRCQAARPGRTYITRCHPDVRSPIAVLDGWLDALVHETEAAGDDPDDGRDAEHLQTATSALRAVGPASGPPPDLLKPLTRMLRRRGAKHPVRLWMDDVQWLEPPARAIVQALVDVPLPGVRLLLSARGADVPVQFPARTLTVALSGLSPEHMRQWATLKAIDIDGLDVEDWIARTHGHPGLLATLLENMAFALNDPFDRRYEALSDAARFALGMICLAKHPLPTVLIARELGEDADGAIQSLRHQRFVVWERVDGRSALRPILQRTVEHTLRLMPAALRARVAISLRHHGVSLADAHQGG